MENYEKAKEILKEYKQFNILKYLEKDKNDELIKQILSIDFEQIKNLKENLEKEKVYNNDKIEKISYIDENKLDKDKKEYYKNIGESIISKGKYAVVTMAGGQRNKVRT